MERSGDHQSEPGLKLGEAAISVVHRSDGSGTTFNFANYLSKVSEEWKSKVGEGTSIQWPVGVGGKGNEGVAEYVKQIKNSIGYVELAYALQSKMAWAAMKNRAGNFVGPSLETFQAAAASADWTKAKDFYLVITDAPGPNSWPIAASSFVLMYSSRRTRHAARPRWSSSNGLWRRARRRPRRWTTWRCLIRWSSRSKRTGPARSSRVRGTRGSRNQCRRSLLHMGTK